MDVRRRRFGGFGIAALGAVAFAALACAGSQGDGDAAPADATTPTDAPPGEPQPLPEGTFGVWWLEEAGGSCVWKEQLLGPIAVDEQTLAELPGPCPAGWRIALAPDSDRVVLYGEGGGFVLGRGAIVPFGPVKDKFPLVVAAGGEVLACGDVEGAEVETGSDTHQKWVLDGKTYEFDNDGGIEANLIRTWKLEDQGWVVRSVAPVQLHEGVSAPWCDMAEDWPEDTVQIDPSKEPRDNGSGWSTASDVDMDALAALAPDKPWSVRKNGRIAIPMYWFEGVSFGRPVAWNPTGSAWEIVPELSTGDSEFAVRGDWLLANHAGGAVLRDTKAGKVVWQTKAVALFAPEGLSLPPLPPPGTAPAPAGNQPVSAPARPRPDVPRGAKGKGKGKGKTKQP